MTYERQELALPVLELGWILNMIFLKKKSKRSTFQLYIFSADYLEKEVRYGA